MSRKEKSYLFQIRAHSCNYVIRINDAYICHEDEQTDSTEEFYVNEWIFEGKNFISFEVEPLNVEILDKSTISIVLTEVIKEGENKEENELSRIEFVDLKTDYQHKVIKPFWIKDLPFRSKNYDELQAIDLTDKELYQTFYQTAKDYYSLFQHRELLKIMPLHAFKSEQYEDRFYRPKGDIHEQLREAIQRSFETEILMPFKEISFRPQLHLYGHLISLNYTVDQGIHFIRYVDLSAEFINYFNTYWALNEKGQFYIYR